MLARWYDLQRKEAGKGIKVLNGFIYKLNNNNSNNTTTTNNNNHYYNLPLAVF